MLLCIITAHDKSTGTVLAQIIVSKLLNVFLQLIYYMIRAVYVDNHLKIY